PAERLDRLTARGLGHARRRPRRDPVGRPAAAAGPGPRAAVRPGRAGAGRADRAPGPGEPGPPGRRPAGRQRGPEHAADHPRPDRAGPGGRDHRAHRRPRGGARQPRRAQPRQRPLPPDAPAQRLMRRAAHEPRRRSRQSRRWLRRAAAPTRISSTTLSRSWNVEPRAARQLWKATDSPMSAAAGIVVTEMNTPIRAPALASVSETTPMIPAATAMMTENMSGLLIRSDTGLRPSL